MRGGVSRQSVWIGDNDMLEGGRISGGCSYRIGIIQKMRGPGSMQLIFAGDGFKMQEVRDGWAMSIPRRFPAQ